MRFHHLAQMNVARALDSPESPLLADFMAAIDDINRLAEAAPGFVWRLKDEASGNATSIQAFEGDPFMLTNMSVWESPEALRDFVYRSAHAEIYRNRTKWFERPAPGIPHQVLWWIPAGHVPSPEEGQARLDWLREKGPSPAAFTFAHTPSMPPDAPPSPAPAIEPVTPPMNLDGRRFRVVSNSANGDIEAGMVFVYRQHGARVWSVYSGQSAKFGSLVAIMDSEGGLEMRYQHVGADGAFRTGRCRSTPERCSDGRWLLREDWQWTNGEGGRGESLLEEID